VIHDLPLLRANFFRRGPSVASGVVIALVILIALQIFGACRRLQEATDDLHRSQSTTLTVIEEAGKCGIFTWACAPIPNRLVSPAAVGPLA
jgi:hypothetical protein